ncbi:MAG: cobalamin-binding protein [Phycisphaeraceae bacterium]
MATIPRRIVCLTAETAEVLYRIGAADRVVGVSCYAPPPPDGVKRPVVSVFTTFRYEVIESLKPDLVLAFSDLQIEAVRELSARGYPVFLTNPRTLDEVLATIVMVGQLVDCADAARGLADQLQTKLDAARREAEAQSSPTIYFEEWDDPLITGIAWVGELIEAVGARDAFAELRDRPSAAQRIITPDDVLQRRPNIIIASWCGKRARLDRICARPGWHDLPAVRDGAVHELDAADVLRPGPGLFTEGLPRLQAIVRQWRGRCAAASPGRASDIRNA